MSARHFAQAFDEIAQKWRNLAQRRCDYFIELYDSGRWKNYYSEEQFLDRMREAIQTSERWIEIAPRPADEVFAEQARAAVDSPRRTAA
jgi:uncharacterized repeat protein (TIGR03809 family)